jgi:hypothetical protein
VSTRTYRAYDHKGELVLSTWAASGGAQFAEEAVYQRRLNRGDFGCVYVTSDDPQEKPFTMRMQADSAT